MKSLKEYYKSAILRKIESMKQEKAKQEAQSSPPEEIDYEIPPQDVNLTPRDYDYSPLTPEDGSLYQRQQRSDEMTDDIARARSVSRLPIKIKKGTVERLNKERFPKQDPFKGKWA
jgi:hypothetical protein